MLERPYTSSIKKDDANNDIHVNEEEKPKVEAPIPAGAPGKTEEAEGAENIVDATVSDEIPAVVVPEGRPLETGEGAKASEDYASEVKDVNERLKDNEESEPREESEEDKPEAKDLEVRTPGQRARSRIKGKLRRKGNASGIVAGERELEEGPKRRKGFENWEKRHQTNINWGMAYASDVARGLGATADALSRGMGLIDKMVRGVFNKNLMSDPMAPAQGMVNALDSVGQLTDKALAKVREDMGIKVDGNGNIAYDPTMAPGTLRAVNFNRRQASLQAGENAFNGIAGNAIRDVLKKNGVDVDADTIMNDPRKLAEAMEDMTGADVREISDIVNRQMRPYMDRIRANPGKSEADRHMLQMYGAFSRKLLESAQHYTRGQRNIYNEGMARFESARRALRGIERGMNIDMHSWYDNTATPDERVLVDAMGGIDDFTRWVRGNPDKVNNGDVDFGENEWRRIAKNTLDWLNSHEGDGESKGPEVKDMYDRVENAHINAVDWLNSKKDLRMQYDPSLMSYADRVRNSFEEMYDGLDENERKIVDAMDTGSTRHRKDVINYKKNNGTVSLGVLTNNDLQKILENSSITKEFADEVATELVGRKELGRMRQMRIKLETQRKNLEEQLAKDPDNEKLRKKLNDTITRYNSVSKALGYDVPDDDNGGEGAGAGGEPRIDPVGGGMGGYDLDDFDNWSPVDQLYINLAGGIDEYRRMVKEDPDLLEDMSLPDEIWEKVYDQVEEYLNENYDRYRTIIENNDASPEAQEFLDEYNTYSDLFTDMGGYDEDEDDVEYEDVPEGNNEEPMGEYDIQREEGYDPWDDITLTSSNADGTEGFDGTYEHITDPNLTSTSRGDNISSITDEVDTREAPRREQEGPRDNTPYIPPNFSEEERESMRAANKKELDKMYRNSRASLGKDKMTTKWVYDNYYAPLYGKMPEKTIMLADNVLNRYGKYIDTATPEERLDSYKKYKRACQNAASRTGKSYTKQIEAMDRLIDFEKGLADSEKRRKRLEQEEADRELVPSKLPVEAQKRLNILSFDENAEPKKKIISLRNIIENTNDEGVRNALTRYYNGILGQYAVDLLTKDVYEGMDEKDRAEVRADVKDFLENTKMAGVTTSAGLESFLRNGFKEYRQNKKIDRKFAELEGMVDTLTSDPNTKVDDLEKLLKKVDKPALKKEKWVLNEEQRNKQKELANRIKGDIIFRKGNYTIGFKNAHANRGKGSERIGTMGRDAAKREIRQFVEANAGLKTLSDDTKKLIMNRLYDEYEKDREAYLKEEEEKKQSKQKKSRASTKKKQSTVVGKRTGTGRYITLEDGTKREMTPEEIAAEREAERKKRKGEVNAEETTEVTNEVVDENGISLD